MKAVVQERYGDASVLRFTDVERPVPKAGEVLVKVHAAAFNHGDRVDLHGEPRIARLQLGVRRPKVPIPGRAIAGTVELAGPGVTAWAPGDAVLAETTKRGFAEYIAVPADTLAAKPAGITFEQAATLPVSGTTALQAVRLVNADENQRDRSAHADQPVDANQPTGMTINHVDENQPIKPVVNVLINGASGGVGTFAVQLAKLAGAAVTAVCSPRNAARARALGAERVVDYTREDFTKGTERYDAVIDLAGGYTVGGMLGVLTERGVFIGSNGTGGRVLGPLPRLVTIMTRSALHRGRVKVVLNQPNPAALTTLAAMVADGRLVPEIERVWSLNETAAALHALETEHARGKIVLTV
ncbi:NAD(P)-dependent alcohol dehydrogenase [Dactylosporangium sp. NPDC051541]|uniref:NAD(P)-dependent alcohol dehydrogenase n=1 Tax=Dactylosporangium sp. NPDC051541 TaxID=3363977 RepID=UPI0037B9AD78